VRLRLEIFLRLHCRPKLGEDLVQPLHTSHGGLDVQRPHILPVLLQQRYEEVYGEVSVLHKVVSTHPYVTNCHRQTQNLLHLKLDSGLEIIDLGVQIISVGDESWELASSIESRAQYPGNLPDKRLACEESSVLPGELLHLLLVLVEFLEVLRGHAWYAEGGSLVTMLLVAQDAHGEVVSRDVLQPLC